MPQQWESAVGAIHAPQVGVAELVMELRALRKGRGVQAGQSVERIGPVLRTVCAIADHDSPTEALDKVADWLRDMIASLPTELQVSAVGAFGLDEDVQLRYLHDRVKWVARSLDRDDRTARRRMDEAIDRLGKQAVHVEKQAIDLREFLGRRVRIAVSIFGAPGNEVVWRCYLVAVARDLDRRDRYFAVVQAYEDTARPIAIPTMRIRQVTPIGNDISRPGERTDD